MPLLARIVLGLCGAALALYAGANFAGVVEPPWWRRQLDLAQELAVGTRIADEMPPLSADPVTGEPTPTAAGLARSKAIWDEAHEQPGREWISGAIGAVGLTLAGFAVLGRRRAEAR